MKLNSCAQAPSARNDRAGWAYDGSTNCTKKEMKNKIAFGLSRLTTSALRYGRSTASFGARDASPGSDRRASRPRHSAQAPRSIPTASHVR